MRLAFDAHDVQRCLIIVISRHFGRVAHYAGLRYHRAITPYYAHAAALSRAAGLMPVSRVRADARISRRLRLADARYFAYMTRSFSGAVYFPFGFWRFEILYISVAFSQHCFQNFASQYCLAFMPQ